MKITPNVICYEFIGTDVTVTKSGHPHYVGISGKIINETRNMFTILHEGKKKHVPKKATVFNFKFLDGAIVEITGSLLLGKPENRLKKRIRRLW